MRTVYEDVSQWDDGRYFLFYQGDELLLSSNNDVDAIAEAEHLRAQLDGESQ